ncbi:MAG: porin [Pseudomonadota bacterium]
MAAGNLTGPTRALGASLDVFSGSTGIGANSALLGKLGNNLIGGLDANNNAVLGADCNRSSNCTSLFDTRWKNAVAYISPNLSGFTLTAAYVANENKAADNVAALNTKGYDVGANYSNGPITAGITYNAASLGNAVDTKANDLRIGGSYNFGVASLRLVYDRVKAENVALGGDELKQNVWGIGGTYNVTANGKLVAQYYKASDLKGSVALGAGADTGAKLFALGYEHSLSKRTLLKATYSRLSNDNNASYDYGINAVGINGAAGAANGAALSGFQVGVRHSF